MVTRSSFRRDISSTVSATRAERALSCSLSRSRYSSLTTCPPENSFRTLTVSHFGICRRGFLRSGLWPGGAADLRKNDSKPCSGRCALRLGCDKPSWLIASANLSRTSARIWRAEAGLSGGARGLPGVERFLHRLRETLRGLGCLPKRWLLIVNFDPCIRLMNGRRWPDYED
jgi:hypothetical protein